MEYLLHPEKDETEILSEKKGQGEGPGREITDIAATAQSLQPTGYTLETTVVGICARVVALNSTSRPVCSLLIRRGVSIVLTTKLMTIRCILLHFCKMPKPGSSYINS